MSTELGIIFVILLVSTAGVLAGRKVHGASDFLTGNGKASSWLTTGALVGTLLGSQCTLGTAQLAFSFGLSAWWFTIGTGLGCIVLGLTFSDRLRRSGCTTQFQIIAGEYGTLAEKAGGILCTTGTFVSVLAQVTACIGFIPVLYPSADMLTASALTVIFMCLYIVMGGTWGAGMGGIVKVILLCVSCSVCLAVVLIKSGGISGAFANAENFLLTSSIGRLTGNFSHEDFSSHYLSMTARGTLKDLGSCVSLILGILSTQTYMQYILSARGEREARKSLYWAGVLVPPAGAAGIFIGLFMRANYITQAEVNVMNLLGLDVPDLPVIASTIQVFPLFVMNHIHPSFAGIILGTLLITIISGSSGLLLGISAILTEDIFSALPFVKSHKLFFSRLVVIITLVIAATASNLLPIQAINDLGFFSMTLRASVVFMPLLCALYFKGRISPRWVLASVILSPTLAIAGNVIGVKIEPLVIAMGVSILCCVIGHVMKD
ncbi:MAG: sodium:solute symporter family protein [Synergistaceae bacterium]|nr:sodium:solute symporter family protein [Synergistaceae bacterium]